MDHLLSTVVPLVLGGTTFFLIEHQLGIKCRKSAQLAGGHHLSWAISYEQTLVLTNKFPP